MVCKITSVQKKEFDIDFGNRNNVTVEGGCIHSLPTSIAEYVIVRDVNKDYDDYYTISVEYDHRLIFTITASLDSNADKLYKGQKIRIAGWFIVSRHQYSDGWHTSIKEAARMETRFDVIN